MILRSDGTCELETLSRQTHDDTYHDEAYNIGADIQGL